MRRTRIAYFIGSLETGGAEGQVMELLRRLDRSRFLPSLILFEPSTGHRVGGLVEEVFALDIPKEPIRSYRPRGVRALLAFLRLCRYLRRRRPDILHAHLPAACILGLTAGRMCRIPVLVGSRRALSASYRSSDWAYDVADRLTTRFGHVMVGNAAAVTREIVEIDRISANKSVTIYNGVDTERFHPSRDRAWRSRYGWGEQDVVFGTVANFFPYKRHIDFVEAAAILHGKHPNARFVIVGEDRGEMAAVCAAINQHGLDHRIQIVPGTDRPEDLFAAIDVSVCSSDSEGFSNVILEAMASGKPVIATAVGGNTEAVIDGTTGVLVPRRSPAAIAFAEARLVGDAALRRLMGANARQRVEEHFSLTRMVRSHEELYTRLLEQRSNWFGQSLAQVQEAVDPLALVAAGSPEAEWNEKT